MNARQLIKQELNSQRRRVFFDAYNGGYVVHGYAYANTKEHASFRDALCDLERRVLDLYGLSILCATGSFNHLTEDDYVRVVQVHDNAVKHAKNL